MTAPRRHFGLAVAAALALLLGAAPAAVSAQPATAPGAATAPVQLRVFAGGANQRPDLMRRLFDAYTREHPHVRIAIETGGATSDLQRQYLSTVLNARDPSIDVYLIDIVNPAPYFSAGWLEPLNPWFGDAATAMKPYLPVYAETNVVGGQIAAMPAYADAMFMFYRRDLLHKHGIAEPRTWDELAAAARRIQQAEADPRLQGLSIQGAPIEGAVCTFLLPYWSRGKELTDATGRPALDREAAAAGLRQWLAMMDAGVIKKNVAEVKTGDTVNEFKAGQVVFAVNWAWAWDRFQGDADSAVKGRVGVMPLPAVAGGRSVTCIGGWQWAVSAFSRHKAEAARLVRHLSSREASRFLAVEGAMLPTYLENYTHPDVLRQAPWFADAARVVVAARGRPQHRDYAQVSDAIRSSTSAVLARHKTPEEGVADIASRLRRIMR